MTPEPSSDGLIFKNFLGVAPQTSRLQSMLTNMLCSANCCLLKTSNILILQMYWTPLVAIFIVVGVVYTHSLYTLN